METAEKAEIYNGFYLSLFSDGTIGLNDGVGYIDTLDAIEVENLYKALRDYFDRRPVE